VPHFKCEFVNETIWTPLYILDKHVLIHFMMMNTLIFYSVQHWTKFRVDVKWITIELDNWNLFNNCVKM